MGLTISDVEEFKLPTQMPRSLSLSDFGRNILAAYVRVYSERLIERKRTIF